jgi:nitrogen fixation/metabolism regulation signal transduction histidine kinase
MPEVSKTEFAPAERADAGAITAQAVTLGNVLGAAPLFDAVNDLVVVLNRHRQIVFANRNVTKLLGLRDDATLRGQRPGEAFGCMHACESPGGCGTTKFCGTCGAVGAILTSLAGRQDVQECRILRDKPFGALDLLVRATPLDIDGERFVICAIADISHEKRRRVLEHGFFHDVLKTALSVRFAADALARSASGPGAEAFRSLQDDIGQLVHGIEEERDLMAAESSELTVSLQPLSAGKFLEALVEMCRRAPSAKDRQLHLVKPGRDLRLQSDPALLGRVVTNMIRNALEASAPGETVSVAVKPLESGVEFRVHNPAVMSEEVQLQVFQRSFSTKGSGRGLGTYVIKLLSERYLGGKVSFNSTEDAGTVFRASFPLDAGGGRG